MGIYSRDYIREDDDRPGGMTGGSNEWMVRSVIVACIAVFVGQNLTTVERGFLVGGLTDLFLLSLTDLQNFEVWRVLTYGLCHGDPRHLFFNMLGLWVLGRMIEPIYGSLELMAVFVVGVVISGLAEVGEHLLLESSSPPVIGASGGVMSVTLLAACVFPRAPMRLMFLPFSFELRYLAAFYVVMDVLGFTSSDNVAHVAHLAGAAWGGLYFQSGLRLTGKRHADSGQSRARESSRKSPARRFTTWLTRLFGSRKGSSNAPAVKLYEPPTEDFDKELDRILLKQAREGAAQLTAEENEFLQYASVRMQNRRGRTTGQ